MRCDVNELDLSPAARNALATAIRAGHVIVLVDRDAPFISYVVPFVQNADGTQEWQEGLCLSLLGDMTEDLNPEDLITAFASAAYAVDHAHDDISGVRLALCLDAADLWVESETD